MPDVTVKVTDAGGAVASQLVTIALDQSVPVDAALEAIPRNGTGDQTAALNAWLASIPNGATKHFPVGSARYKIEGTLTGLQGKTGVTLEGHGAEFFATTDTANGSRMQWQIQKCKQTTLRDVKVRGSSPTTGPEQEGGVFKGPMQWQHGIAIFSCEDFLLDRANVGGTWGDCVYIGQVQGTDPISRRITVQDSTIIGASRQLMAITNCDGFTIVRNIMDKALYQIIDCEVHDNDDIIANGYIGENWFGSHSPSTNDVAVGGGAAADAHHIWVNGNRKLDKGATPEGLDRYPMKVSIRPNETRRWNNIAVTNNQVAVYGLGKVFFEAAWVDVVTATGNYGPVKAVPGGLHQPLDSSQPKWAWPRVSAEPFNRDDQNQAPIVTRFCTQVTSTPNSFVPKPGPPAWLAMPDAVNYTS